MTRGRPRVCRRPGCGVLLTPRQVARGTRLHSRACHAATKRVHPQGPAACVHCGAPLTLQQRQRRRGRPESGQYCSVRCAIRARWGRQGTTRTHCALPSCGAPLTRHQQWRRRTYCSKSCAKVALHAERPLAWARMTATSHAVQRQRYVARLRAFLQACPDAETAARRGVENGRRVAWSRAGHGSWPRVHRYPRGHWQALARTVATAAPSKAEAFREGYRRAYADGIAMFDWRKAA